MVSIDQHLVHDRSSVKVSLYEGFRVLLISIRQILGQEFCFPFVRAVRLERITDVSCCAVEQRLVMGYRESAHVTLNEWILLIAPYLSDVFRPGLKAGNWYGVMSQTHSISTTDCSQRPVVWVRPLPLLRKAWEAVRRLFVRVPGTSVVDDDVLWKLVDEYFTIMAKNGPDDPKTRRVREACVRRDPRFQSYADALDKLKRAVSLRDPTEHAEKTGRRSARHRTIEASLHR